MIDHRIEDIERTERIFNEGSYNLLEVSLAGRNLRYYQLPQSLNPDLPDFIYRATNNQTKRYVMGVSESVPVKLQPYFILAEYAEFIEIGIDKPDRVMESEKIVLKAIPAELSRDYIERKISLYRMELKLDRIQPQKYALGDEGRQEFEKAVRFLEDKLKFKQKS